MPGLPLDKHLDDEQVDAELDFSDLEEKYSVQMEEGFNNIVIMDNMPIVDESKRPKLLAVIQKLAGKAGKLKGGDAALFMPMGEDGKSKGFLFAEYVHPEDAHQAVKTYDGYKLDKTHTLTVSKLSDFERYMRTAEEYSAPEMDAFVEKEHMKDWLKDIRARDQFVTLVDDDVTILWNEKGEQPENVHSRPAWTETYVQWSPLGSYLTTFHRQGVALWGGPSWQKIMRFVCPMTKVLQYSPKESYIVTLSSEPFDGENNLGVWEVATGKLLRGYPVDGKDPQGWPFFKWSHDEQYIARCTPGVSISVYEVPSMRLLDNKSIKIEDVRDFFWSPKDNIIAYWSPESDNSPARVTCQEIPSRNIIRTKNLFNVTAATLSWQSNGDFLACRLERSTKTKKTTYPSLELFRMREKNIPIEVVELKAPMAHFAWEPSGDRFIVVTAEGPNKMGVQIYLMEPITGNKPGQVKLLKSLDRKSVNQVFWSPKGRFAVFGGLKSFSGELEFYDTDEMATLNTGEHYGATDVEWDPTGRYVVSSFTLWRPNTDTGYQLWDFKGTLLMKSTIPQLKQYLWRPRPASLLSAEEQKKIKKSLRDYTRQFDEEDARASSRVSREVELRRQRMMDEWHSWRSEVLAQYEATEEERRALLGLDDEEEDEEEEEIDASDAHGGASRKKRASQQEEIEELVEEIIEETEELI